MGPKQHPFFSGQPVLPFLWACRYMHEQLHVPKEQVEELCLEYYLNYGTTLAGLVVSLKAVLPGRRVGGLAHWLSQSVP